MITTHTHTHIHTHPHTHTHLNHINATLVRIRDFLQVHKQMLITYNV